jgi:hypothetical protein
MTFSKLTITLVLLCIYFQVQAQELPKPQQKVKLFMDCSSTWCDLTFIRSEINIVDFVFDRLAADVHVLVTTQTMGNGGDTYQMIFFGQKNFSGQKDTLRFNMLPLATEVEIRDKLLTYLKVGLVPYVAKTDMLKHITLNMKRSEGDTSRVILERDNWNYWVFRVGANGSMNVDQNYVNTDLNGSFSANRTTEKLKVDFRLSTGKNRSVYDYENEFGEEESFTVINTRYNFNNTLVLAINDHWSYGYYLFMRNSTFSNYQYAVRFIPAIEYNIFPYKEVNNKYLAFSYGIDFIYNNYYDKTIYNKMSEGLMGHSAQVVAAFNQKWGTLSSSVNYSNFFHDWKQFSLEMNLRAEVRVTGNLSFFAYAFGGLTRNQVFISSGGASVEDVLARRRQLASGYNFGTFFGVNYRFGSILNNFVNPRFSD